MLDSTWLQGCAWLVSLCPVAGEASVPAPFETPTLDLSESFSQLDQCLPPESKVKEVWTSCDPDGVVAVAWTEAPALEFSATAPSSRPELRRRQLRVGAAILPSDGQGSPRISPNLITLEERAIHVLYGIAHLEGSWHIGLQIDPGSISIAEISGSRLKPPVHVASAVDDVSFLRMTSDETAMHFFWNDFFHYKWDPPDIFGGRTRHRIRHLRFHEAKADLPQTLYTARPGSFELQHMIVEVAPGSFDLFFLREIPSGIPFHASGPYTLVHVSDTRGRQRAKEIARCGVATKYVAAMGPRGLQLLWLEEDRRDIGGAMESITQCSAASYIAGEWHGPTRLGRDSSWKLNSITMGILTCSAKQTLVGLWQGRDSHLTYVTSSDGLHWSQPIVIPRQIGSRNWLCARKQGAVLITERAGHLYAWNVNLGDCK